MPRVSIALPDCFAFSTEIPVLIEHINFGGHLDNVQLLSIVSEARMRFFKALGYGDLIIDGVSIIAADAAVQYRSEGFHGEVMVVSMTANDFSRKGCDLPWRMTEKTSGREVARGKTGIVFFDYATRRVVAVPASFRRRFDE